MKEAIKEAIQRLNKFDSLEDINEGGNSYAFCSMHRQLQSKRFLKAIYLSNDEQDSILREPRTLVSALSTTPNPPNIVKIHDAEIIAVGNDQYLLLQMEWIDGRSLQTILESRSIGQQEGVRIGLGLLHGLTHLHHQRLVHRDLKPGNILLDRHTAKITDFGSVALINPNETFVNASKHSDLYVPAEGWGTPRKYFFSSDVYQAALVLYQLINGPFPTEGHYYLTKTVKARLKREKRSYEAMDGFAKATVEKESFAELTKKERLLITAKAPRPYYSVQLRRLIDKAVKANPSERISLADFLTRLSHISVPDWKPVDEHFIATNWKSWDWQIYLVKRRKGLEVNVERARHNTNKYRKTLATTDLNSAFRYVEAQ